SRSRSTFCAMGERQTLPVQTVRMRNVAMGVGSLLGCRAASGLQLRLGRVDVRVATVVVSVAVRVRPLGGQHREDDAQHLALDVLEGAKRSGKLGALSAA